MRYFSTFQAIKSIICVRSSNSAAFERTGDADRATKIYDVLVNRSDADTRLRVLFRLVDLDLRKRKLALAASRLEKSEIPAPESDEGRVAFNNLRAMVRRSATESTTRVGRWDSTQRAPLVVAERFYELYLTKFLRGEESAHERNEIEMYLAEVKRDLGKSKEASELYQKVLRSHDERYAKEAGTLWVASLAEAIKKQGKTPGKTSKEPSELELEFVRASDELSRALPDTAESREARMQSAQVLAGYTGTQREALKRTQALVDEHSGSKQGLVAAKLWIQTITERLPESPSQAAKQKETVEDLEEAVRALKSNSRLLATDQKIGKGEVRKLIQESQARLEVIHLAES